MGSDNSGEAKMSNRSSQTMKISTFVVLIIFVLLALSIASLLLAFQAFSNDHAAAAYLLLTGFFGVAISTYILVQTRRRILRLRVASPPVTTTIECRRCGFKSIREFKRGDYIFKEVEPCQKCNENMMITAIYREVKEREKPSYF